MGIDLQRAMDVAREAVRAGGAAALVHFDAGVAVETKPDRSPVTRADREAEAAILGVIRAAFPGHAILAEESGEHAGAEARWIVDPLDGTRGFTRGGSFWGPLVGCEQGGRVVAGAMALPVTGDLFWAARGLGCWYARAPVGAGLSPAPTARGGDAPRRLAVSGVARWEDAVLSLGELHLLLGPPYAAAVTELARTAVQARCYGDLASCAQLLLGRADAWLEAGVKPWDLAPLEVLVEEAGGRFTDFAGTPTVFSGNAIATNGHLHGHVLARMASLG